MATETTSIPPIRLAWSVDEAAHIIGISERKMYDIVRSREIQSIKLGGRRLIRHVDIEQFLAELVDAS
jgi:excisionase family DNA binding protein